MISFSSNLLLTLEKALRAVKNYWIIVSFSLLLVSNADLLAQSKTTMKPDLDNE